MSEHANFLCLISSNLPSALKGLNANRYGDFNHYYAFKWLGRDEVGNWRYYLFCQSFLCQVFIACFNTSGRN